MDDYQENHLIEASKSSIGKTIKSIKIVSNKELIIVFEDNSAIKVFDNGQQCCENRYLSCDDDLNDLVGEKLRHISTKTNDSSSVLLKLKYEVSPDEDHIFILEKTEYGELHEAMFVEVATDQWFITLVTHNEHNGYYGGFDVAIEEIGENELETYFN